MTKPTGRPVGRPKNPPKPKAPAKPRGRPPGAKNKPNSLAAFLVDAIQNPIEPPAPKPVRKVGGPWAGMTPEERSAHAKALAAKRTVRSGGGNMGIPRDMTKADHEAVMATARPLAKRIIKIMQKKGQLPELDPRAEEAMAVLLTMVRGTATVRDKTAIAKTILDFTMPKPTTKSEVTVKSAEDLLDEVADALGLPEVEPEE